MSQTYRYYRLRRCENGTSQKCFFGIRTIICTYVCMYVCMYTL